MQNYKQQSELITVIPLTLCPNSLLTKLTPLTNILDVDTIAMLANNIEKWAKLSIVQVADREAWKLNTFLSWIQENSSVRNATSSTEAFARMESSASLFTLQEFVTRSSKEMSVLINNARTGILTNVETTKKTMDVLGEVSVSFFMLFLKLLMLLMMKWKEKKMLSIKSWS